MTKTGDGVEVQQPFRFPGQYEDAETGLYYNYYRDYDPQIGRYVEADPIGLDGGGNIYIYSNNDGINYIDVFGECPESVGLPWHSEIQGPGKAYGDMQYHVRTKGRLELIYASGLCSSECDDKKLHCFYNWKESQMTRTRTYVRKTKEIGQWSKWNADWILRSLAKVRLEYDCSTKQFTRVLGFYGRLGDGYYQFLGE